eukprot:5058992-Alexandrium_andersonii.AAC.1
MRVAGRGGAAAAPTLIPELRRLDRDDRAAEEGCFSQSGSQPRLEGSQQKGSSASCALPAP